MKIFKRMSSTDTQGEVLRGPTFGEKAVGLSFNPGGDPNVLKAKQLCAEVIDLLINTPFEQGSEGAAMKLHAIRELQTAQMWAVKVITMTCNMCKGNADAPMVHTAEGTFDTLGCYDVYKAWKDAKEGGTPQQYYEWLKEGKPNDHFATWLMKTHLMEKYG